MCASIPAGTITYRQSWEHCGVRSCWNIRHCLNPKHETLAAVHSHKTNRKLYSEPAHHLDLDYYYLTTLFKKVHPLVFTITKSNVDK